MQAWKISVFVSLQALSHALNLNCFWNSCCPCCNLHAVNPYPESRGTLFSTYNCIFDTGCHFRHCHPVSELNFDYKQYSMDVWEFKGKYTMGNLTLLHVIAECELNVKFNIYIQGIIINEKIMAILNDIHDKVLRTWHPWLNHFPPFQLTMRFLELWLYAPRLLPQSAQASGVSPFPFSLLPIFYSSSVSPSCLVFLFPLLLSPFTFKLSSLCAFFSFLIFTYI